LKLAYYNEPDPYAAQWLRNLIAAGHIASGDVDERRIEDVAADDLVGYRQCHFFAGIGVWSYTLRLAGWPDDRPVWTGSCPCQGFSSAGRRLGMRDPRHLWPVWRDLIALRRPRVVFGEQVDEAIAVGWLDLVRSQLEDLGYAFAATGLPAAGVGAPHARNRIFFVADSDWHGRLPLPGAGLLADAEHDPEPCLPAGLVAHSHRERRNGSMAGGERGRDEHPDDGAARPVNGFWGNAHWLPCRDGRWRPVEPGTFPLAHGAAARVGRLRAYGNAIVPQVAAAFVAAYLDLEGSFGSQGSNEALLGCFSK
jgi:DNA (cytosine-5)-methyltransferase 1